MYNTGMLIKFFKEILGKKPSRIEKGKHIYAIGDIHGKLALLQKLCDKIHKDIESHDDDIKIIFLGDYIDRGEDSKNVINLILSLIDADLDVVCLMGNHEKSLSDFLENGEKNFEWLMWGGSETLKSYGVNFEDENGKPYSFNQLSNQLSELIPDSHKQFYNNLKLYHEEDDYIFVHAGIRPSLTMDKQEENDLIRIRRDFIQKNHKIDKTIVFGHTTFEEPFEGKRKIGIDTGAYATGCLTSVVLFEDQRYFINSL